MATNYTDESQDDFSGRICQLVHDGHLCLSIGLGVRTGLWEAMAQWDQPKTSAEIADATKLKERYVREWLGAMVTGNIIKLTADSDTEKFLLPPHRRRALTRAGETESSAVYSLCVPAMAEVFPKIEQCFELDGPKGLSYSDYSDQLWSVLGGIAEDKYNKYLLSDVIPAVSGMADALNAGARILEIGCGPGVVALLIAEAFPKCSIVATDYTSEALEIVRAKVADQQLKNISVAEQDASNLPANWSGTFDYVLAFDMVHNTAHPATVLSECHKVLKSSGAFLMTEAYMQNTIAENVGDPFVPVQYTYSLMNCVPVSLYHDGVGLGAVWGVQSAKEMVINAGFTNVQWSRFPAEKGMDRSVDVLFIGKK